MEIAERLGLAGDVISEAKRLVSREALKLDDLIQSLEFKLRQADEEKEAVNKKRQELERDKLVYESKLREMKAEAKQIREKAREEARSLIRESKEELEKVMAKVREDQVTEETLAQARRALVEEEKKAAKEETVPEVIRTGEPLVKPKVGEKVWVSNFNREGVLISFSSDKARVEMGGVRVEMPIALLSRPERKDGEIPKAEVNYDRDRDFSPELMLLGLRADEALEKLDQYLDQAELVGLRQVRVVHGKGSGILRRKVGEVLGRDHRVKSHRLGEWDEGGTGVTIVELS